jgi:hypothetical protein
MHHHRQQRLKVLEALEAEARQFRTRQELFPLRIPREPVVLEVIVERALGEEASRFDLSTLRARTILHLEWEGGEAWDAWVIMLPSQLRLFCDSGADEVRVLASGGRNAGDETDRMFLELLSESAGDIFGIEMAGDAPSRVRSSIADSDFLVGVFVNFFEVRGIEDSVRQALVRHGLSSEAGADFRDDVERWLVLVGGERRR